MKDTSHPEEPAATADMERADSVGSFLQQERLRQHKTLQEVAESTCIHINTVQALEEENRSKLPAEVFVRGFISIYAQYLGLNVQEALNRYGRQTAAEWVSPEAKAIHFPEESGPIRHFALMLVAACVAALLGYGGYQLLMAPIAENLVGDEFQMAQGESAMPEIAGDEIFTPDFAATDLLEPALSAPEIPDFFPERPRDDEVTPEESAGTGLSPASGHSAALAISLPAAEPTIGAAVVMPSALPTGNFNYVLTAEFTETTWLQIRIDGRDPADHLFQPGQRHRWQAMEQISLFLGNAGGVDLVLNGQPQPKPGRSGQPAKISFPGRRP
jgi:cytoskeleton protein RodZ